LKVLDIVQKIWAPLRKLFDPWCPKLVTGLLVNCMFITPRVTRDARKAVGQGEGSKRIEGNGNL